MDNAKKVARRNLYVVGAGSVGTFLAAKLYPHVETCLVTRNGKKNRFLQGITVTNSSGAQSVRIPTEQWDTLEKFEDGACILITTKAFHLQEALLETLKRTNESHEIILCQNGLGIIEEAEKLSPYRKWGRMSCWFGTRLDFGKTRDTIPLVIVSGMKGIEVSNVSDRAITLLNMAKLHPTRVETPVLLEWRKALSNITINGLCALANIKNGELLQCSELKKAAGVVLDEAIRVAHGEGVDLQEQDRNRVFEVIETTKDNFNSTVQDIKAGRKTEIPWLNSMVVKRGQKLGIPTPTNLLVSSLIQAQS